MAGRLVGKRAIVTAGAGVADPTEYNGADIVALFREEGAEVFAEFLGHDKARKMVVGSATSLRGRKGGVAV